MPEKNRIESQKFSEVVDGVLQAKRWKKSDLAREAAMAFPEFNITAEQVYEWLEAKHEPRAWFAKAMEEVLGINLPPHCYWNVSKR